MSEFKDQINNRIARMRDNTELTTPAQAFLCASAKAKYSYNFHWMDRPIIQYPQNMVAMRELIWLLKPDLIIETGIGHGNQGTTQKPQFGTFSIPIPSLRSIRRFGTSYKLPSPTMGICGVLVKLPPGNL